MKADRYLFDGSHPCALRKLPCDSNDDHVKKEDLLAKTAENLEKMAALQDAFYADGREGLVIILQALDAAGKHGGEGGAGRQPLAAYRPQVKQPSRRIDEAHGSHGEHLDAFKTQLLNLPQHDHVRGRAHDGAGAPQDGGVGEGNEQLGSGDVVVAAEGQDDGHQDDDHRRVVDDGGYRERAQRDD